MSDQHTDTVSMSDCVPCGYCGFDEDPNVKLGDMVCSACVDDDLREADELAEHNDGSGEAQI